MARPIEQLTFREKIRDCAHRTRELIEHLEQSLLPRIHELQAKCKPPRTAHDEPVPDVTIRSLVASLLDSQRYASQIEDQIEAYSQSIDAELNQIMKTPE
jgi:hypothetical protein